MQTQVPDSAQRSQARRPQTGRRRGAITAILLLALAGVMTLVIVTQLPLVGAAGGCGGG